MKIHFKELEHLKGHVLTINMNGHMNTNLVIFIVIILGVNKINIKIPSEFELECNTLTFTKYKKNDNL